MRKVLLTSSGFENRRITDLFLSLFDKRPTDLKALFIPTAAINPEAIAVLPKCVNDLLSAGIPSGHITVFDLHRAMPACELSQYDLVYIAGGDPRYLLERINNSGFREPLLGYIADGGVYVGVSAGSVIAANNLAGNLGIADLSLYVHKAIGTGGGPVDVCRRRPVDLTGNTALLIMGDTYSVIE